MEGLVLLGPWNRSEVVLPTSIVAAVAHAPPFVYVDDGDGSVYSGYLVDLMMLLSEQLRIPIQFRAPRVPPTTDNFNGTSQKSVLIDMLANEEADIALAPFSWTDQHLKTVDYVGRTPVAYFDYGFLVSGSQQSAMDSLTALTAPFHSYVWISLFVSILISAVVLRLTNPVNSDWRGSGYKSSSLRDNVDDMKLTWVSSLLSVFACVTQQAWPATPYPLSARIVTMAVRAMALIIYVQYTASLILIMTQTEVTSEVRSVEQFAERSDWTLLVEPGDERVRSWQTSADQLLRSLYQRIQNRDRVEFFSPRSVGNLLNPRTVGFYDTKLPFFGLQGKACDLVPLRLHNNEDRNMERDRTGGQPQFLTVRKHSPLQQPLATAMQKLFECGAIDRLKRYWFTNTTVYNCQIDAGYSSLAFADLSAVLYLLLSGILASLIVLLTEKLHFQASKLASNTNHTDQVHTPARFLE